MIVLIVMVAFGLATFVSIATSCFVGNVPSPVEVIMVSNIRYARIAMTKRLLANAVPIPCHTRVSD